MGISNIHPIRTTLNLAIDYIVNKEKTDDEKLVFSYGCSSNALIAAKQFLDVYFMGTGRAKVLAQHIIQSFDGTEVTPEQALKIGVETADRLLKGRYQYIVSTHIDKSNIHNHIIFNNVSNVSFRTFEYEENRGKNSWKNLRNINDELCKKCGLKVIENPTKGKGKSYYEWQQDKLGKSWKSKLRVLIDKVLPECKDFDDFLNCLRALKVDVRYTPQNVIKIKFRMFGQERFTRGRTLGWYYDAPQLIRRIEQYNLIRSGTIGIKSRSKLIDTSRDIFTEAPGLKHWAEMENMKEVSKKINYLTTHNITQKSIENDGAAIFNRRMEIIGELETCQRKIEDFKEDIRLLRSYDKVKIEYRSTRVTANGNDEIFKKYHNITARLNEKYPSGIYPTVAEIEAKKSSVIDEFTELNKEYKMIEQKLQEIENARKTLEEYVEEKSASAKEEKKKKQNRSI